MILKFAIICLTVNLLLLVVRVSVHWALDLYVNYWVLFLFLTCFEVKVFKCYRVLLNPICIWVICLAFRFCFYTAENHIDTIVK